MKDWTSSPLFGFGMDQSDDGPARAGSLLWIK
jgi:hypothetical protein